MALLATRLTIELIPHCTSVAREGRAGDHDVRPLAEPGMRQAEALAAVIGTDIEGIYSGPAVRCRQTVGPLAAAGPPQPAGPTSKDPSTTRPSGWPFGGAVSPVPAG